MSCLARHRRRPGRLRRPRIRRQCARRRPAHRRRSVTTLPRRADATGRRREAERALGTRSSPSGRRPTPDSCGCSPDLVALPGAQTPHLLAASSRGDWDRARLYGRTGGGCCATTSGWPSTSPGRMARLLGLPDSMMAANLLPSPNRARRWCTLYALPEDRYAAGASRVAAALVDATAPRGCPPGTATPR